MLCRNLENVFREKVGMDVKLTNVFPPLKDYSPSIPVGQLFILLRVFDCFGKWDGLIMSYSIMIGTIYDVSLHLISHIRYDTVLSCVSITNLETSLVFCQHKKRYGHLTERGGGGKLSNCLLHSLSANFVLVLISSL